MHISFQGKHFSRISLLVLIVSFFSSFILYSPIHAVAVSSQLLNTYTNCNVGSTTAFTGLLGVPKDTYSVYVHLEKRGQSASVRGYGQVNDPKGNGTCVPIGQSSAVSGDNWTYIGNWTQPDTKYQSIFQIASSELGDTLDANRPSLMLVSQTNPVCVPTTQCFVTLDGQSGYVTPPGTLPTLDSLHVVRAIDPSKDTVTGVTYYIDDQAIYNTKTLKAFDLRYVSLANQSLDSVVQYASGQQVVIPSSPPDGFNDSFPNFLFRVFASRPNSLPTISVIVGLSILGGLVVGVYHAFRRHRMWELDHGLIHEKFALVTDRDRRKAFLQDHITTIIRHILIYVALIILALAVVFLINSYAFSTFKVDGKSMESSFNNNDQVLVNKLPVTWNRINNIAYTPKRGDVVILHAIYGLTDAQTASSQENYIIKRVIGLPGERVVVKDSKITVYNTAHPEGFDPDQGSSWQELMHANDSSDDIDVTLGINELFVSGDNRPVSVDSRFNGPIKTSEVVGKVLFRIWPFTR